MTVERNEIFDLAFRFVTETSENIFLTGKAGTGKTTFLKYLKENSSKNIIIAAPTGVAAINAGGVTLHSLFQLPFHPFLPTAAGKTELVNKLKFNRQRQELLRKAELLVIDEISMVRSDVMDAIDTILRSVRRRHRLPFGGIQLLCIGDLYQLPPVAQNREWSILQEYYSSPFFFDSLAVKEQPPLLIELQKIYRQRDQTFVDLLNKVRNNDMSPEDFSLLHSRFIPGFRAGDNDNFITLTSHNNQANLINNSALQKLSAAPFVYEAEIENDFPENLYPGDASLTLKEGAQVMFIKNDPVLKRFFNGKIGMVAALEKDKITVICDGERVDVQPESWDNSKYTLNRADGKLQQEVMGTFTQYPLRLAWAITIHKSQGLTFDAVMIDAAAAFSSGQVYVALSRCTSLDGIVLLSKIPPSAIQSNSNADKAQSSMAHKGSLAGRFEGARRIFVQELVQQIFALEPIAAAVESLYNTVAAHRDRLNSDALVWCNEHRNKIRQAAATGQKFIQQAYALMKDAPAIEEHVSLQDRLAAAAGHFVPLLRTFSDELKTHPLISDHKEAATAVDEELLALYAALHAVAYLQQYCSTPFTVTGFLKHRLNYALEKQKITCYAGARKSVQTDAPNPELYQTLKDWRDAVCENEDVPVFMVATHAALRDICTFLPQNKRSLLLISGFGKVKVDKYGDDIIDAVSVYCGEHDLETTTIPPKKKKSKTRNAEEKTATGEKSFLLFKQGKKITEIAKERNLAEGTVESHLIAFVATGDIEIEELMSREKYAGIMNIVGRRGETKVSELKDRLPDVSFGEIRMAEAAAKFISKMQAEHGIVS